MATSIKISQLPAKGSNLEATDLLEISEFNGTGYITKSITGAEIIASVPPTTVDWGDIGGTLSAQTDLQNALDAKVPTTRTITINGTTQDLSANRTFNISTGITIGTTVITSGTVGRVLFEGTGNVVQESANLFWDNVNGRLGIGTASPQYRSHINVADGTYSTIFSATSGSIRFLPYLSSVYGANISTLNAAQTAQIPLSLSANKFIFENGNVLINTTTDAGYKLDVNGTARVSGSLTVGGTQLFFNGAFYNTINDRNHFGGAVSISTFLRVGTNANTVASAILQADSTTKGFLPPRMTSAERTAIATPATGLMVYQTDGTEGLYIYKSTGWVLNS